MSGTVLGVDVSSWQHPDGHAIDWEAVREAGYVFAIIKATQGVSYVSPWCARDLDDARAAGLLVGAYHYYEAGVPAAEQAQHFTSTLLGERLDLGCWLDWECYPPEQFVYNQELTEFLTTAHKARPGTGLYCDGAWAEALKGSDVLKGRLWAAGGRDPLPGRPLLWQRSEPAEVPGISAPVDVDELWQVRGVDLPTAPRARPTAATVHPPARPPEPEPEETAEAAEEKGEHALTGA